MDGARFDDLTRSLAGGISRRSILGGLAAALAGVWQSGSARAACPPGQVMSASRRCICRQSGRPPVNGLCPCQGAIDCPPGPANTVTTCVNTVCTYPCAPGYVSTPNGCRLALGQPCQDGALCASGYCADGVCCDAACTGQCEGCSAAGHCAPVTGQPVGGRTACINPKTICGGVCNGIASACVYPGSEVPCTATTCTAGVYTPAGACDGAGTCVTQQVSCDPYAVCDQAGTGCATACASDGDCIGAAYCQAGACVGDRAHGEVCTRHAECQTGNCSNGVCCSGQEKGCAGGCIASDLCCTDLDCDDSNPCTVDTCDQTTRQCGHADAPSTTTCGTAGVCCGGSCCESPANGSATCTAGTCDVVCNASYQKCANGTCIPVAVGSCCGDGDCTLGATCHGGTCCGYPKICGTAPNDFCCGTGNHCVSGACQACIESSQVCTTGSTCCTGECLSNGAGLSCQCVANGGFCGTNDDCCDGTCREVGQSKFCCGQRGALCNSAGESSKCCSGFCARSGSNFICT